MSARLRVFRRSLFERLRVKGGAALLVGALIAGCANQPTGYGIGDAAATQAAEQRALAEKEKPDSAAVYLALIEQMQQKDMYFASLAHLDQYEHTYGTSPKTTLMRADALRATDQLAASTSAYRSLIGSPFTAQGYRGLGLIAGAQGDFDGAAQSLGKAAEANPTDSQGLSDFAYALMRSGDLASARIPMMKAAELDQKNPKVMGNLALYLLADGQTKNANGLMDSQSMPKEVRDAVKKDAQAVAAAVREREKRAAAASRSHDRERAIAGATGSGGAAGSASSTSSASATASAYGNAVATLSTGLGASASSGSGPTAGSSSALGIGSAHGGPSVQSVSVAGTATIQPIDQVFPSQQWRQGPALSPFPIAQSVRRGAAD